MLPSLSPHRVVVMIKLMIIDDESTVLEGLRRYIDWSTWGIDLAADAVNAVEGREKALAVHPDIVICDIHMPGKDGLAFCAELKTLFPKLKIIILSGYNEADYLHRALTLGVNEYLLKPAGVDTIVPAVLKLKEEIIAEQTKDKEEYVKETLFVENLMVMRLQFINNLLSSRYRDIAQLQPKARTLGIPLKGPYYQTVLLRKYPEKADDCKSGIQLDMDYWRLTQILESTCAKIPSAYFCEIETFDYFWLLNAGDPQTAEQHVRVLISSLQQAFRSKSDIAIAVGTVAGSVQEISNSYVHASAALCRSAWLEDDNVFCYEAPAIAGDIEPALKKLEKGLIGSLIAKQSALSLELIAQAFTLCREVYYPLTLLRATCKHILLLIAPPSGREDDDAFFTIDNYRIDEIYSGNELEKWITQRVLQYFQNQDPHLSSCLPIISKAVRYIHMNYQNDITLQQLAKELFITPNYLGRLFHQETGCKMSDYLNRFRIERAKELLKNPGSKTSEVAEAVGFTNYKYFLVCFAKYANCSVRDFRSASHTDSPSQQK